MTTRAELRATIRAELNDQGAAQLWPDGRLDRWIVEALRELGRDWPAPKSINLTSVAHQAAYALPGDVLEVTRVEHPSGAFRVPTEGSAADVSGDPGASPYERGDRSYDVYGGELVLSPVPGASGEAIAVRYLGGYAEPASDAGVLDVPARDEDLVVWLVCRRAFSWIDNDEAKRQRFEHRPGPVPAPAARELQRRYEDALRRRRARVGTRRLAIHEC